MIQFTRSLLLAVVWVYCAECSAQYNVSDFQGQGTNIPSGIYQVNVGLNDFSGIVLGYGDFNSDQYNDIITLSQDRNSIDIQYWEDDSFNQSSVCQGITCPDFIMGIIPADYNNDGLLDLMIVCQAEGAGPFTMYTLLQQEATGDSIYPFFFASEIYYSFKSVTYPFVGDFNGNHTTTVMIFDVVNGRQIYDTTTSQATSFSQYASNLPQCIDATQSIMTPFSVPIFNAIIDINSDCRADLVILSNNTQGQTIEYWYTTDQSKSIMNRYCLMHQEQLTDIYIQSMNFVDVNFDGLVDMVMIASPTVDLMEQYIVISYNNYMYLGTVNICQVLTSQDQIVSAYPYEHFSITNSQYRVMSQLLDTRQTQFQIYAYSDSDLLGLFAPFMRFGDFGSTGFPGAIVTLVNQTSVDPISYYVQNVECSNCNFLDQALTNPRMFQLDENPQSFNGLNALSLYPSINGAFFDYGENGRLDFLVNVINRTMTQDIYTIQAFYNNLNMNTSYLQVQGLNGFCTQSLNPSIECQGALYYGATYMFSVTNFNDIQNRVIGFQLCQSAQGPLQLPFGYTGLGQIKNNNLDLYFGLPQQNGALRQWTDIIPNSQLIISPYTNFIENWTIQVFNDETQSNESNASIVAITVVTIVVLLLILLGGLIFWNYIKTKKEVQKNLEPQYELYR